MYGIAPVTGRQFAWFRIVFGAYLTLHFAQLVPYASELFSSAGALPDPGANPTYGILPNALAHWNSPQFATAFVLGLTTLSSLFAMGIARHAAAVLLWYGWACLFNRNVLISNPAIPYVGLLLVLVLLIPAREPLQLGRRDTTADFYTPAAVYWTAWSLMAAGYTFSGIAKLQSPSWIDGSALSHILASPLARNSVLTDFMLGQPSLLALTTWAVLLLEVMFVPLAIYRRTRALAWSSMVALHFAIVAFIDFADLSAGMLMVHLFTADPRWLAQLAPAARLKRLLSSPLCSDDTSGTLRSLSSGLSPTARRSRNRHPAGGAARAPVTWLIYSVSFRRNNRRANRDRQGPSNAS